MTAESRSPMLTLKKTEWECTGTRPEPLTVYHDINGVSVPFTTYHDICVEYSRR